jgi:CubicO group peptidase (beta-lactamase class C family)
MSKKRIPIWLALPIIGIGALVAFVVGLFAYTSLTAPTLHPDASAVPSVAEAAVAKRWASAVAQAQEIARAGLAEKNLPGLSVAVGVNGEIVWAEGFGFANLENKAKVTPDTRFRIGTASTVLTSAAVGLLLEQGTLKLDDDIQNYVPDFRKKEWTVTLRQLMAHTGGVRTDSGDEGPLLSKRCEGTSEGLEAFAERPLLFQPGTEYRFSSYGWILVSAAVEAAATGQSFFTFMRAQIFEPLGMTNTLPDTATGEAANRATPYFPRFAADPRYGPDLMRDIDLSCYAGASAFLSTPSDLVRFALAVNSGTLLKTETVQLLQAPQKLSSGAETGYGLGWDLETATLAGQPTRVVGHDGDVLGGQAASLMSFPDRSGLVVALISNTSYADTYELGLKIAEAFAAKR